MLIGFVDLCNPEIHKVADLYEIFLDEQTYPPSTSHYGKVETWSKWQQKETAILNLRPANNQGLPLSTLHPVFAQFRASLVREVHNKGDMSEAFYVAYHLCVSMADAYEDEKGRRDAFEEDVKPYLGAKLSFRHEFYIEPGLNERHASTADLLICWQETPIAEIEYKRDLGDGGDALVQGSRVYQSWVNHLCGKDSPILAHGAPLILLSVMGT